MSSELTCSAQARACAEPMIGTAPSAARWIAIEDNTPWNGPVPGFLGTEQAAELGDRLKARLVLMRSPGRRARDAGQRRRVLAADALSGRMTALTVDDPAELYDLDWSRLEPAEPVLLVCVHGRRDRCCAIAGRPLVSALAAAYPPGVAWESSHLGGHRFAPTALLLPYGYLYGGLTESLARRVLSEATLGRVVTHGLRGRSAWSPAGQAAELAVRTQAGELDMAALAVTEQGQGQVHVRHRDGRAWLAEVGAAAVDGAGPASCGREPEARSALAVTSVAETPEATALISPGSDIGWLFPAA